MLNRIDFELPEGKVTAIDGYTVTEHNHRSSYAADFDYAKWLGDDVVTYDDLIEDQDAAIAKLLENCNE